MLVLHLELLCVKWLLLHCKFTTMLLILSEASSAACQNDDSAYALTSS